MSHFYNTRPGRAWTIARMTQANKHAGGCHCGKVRYEVELDLSQPLISCNCSICGKTGTVLAFVPTGQFTLHAGADDLTDYQFNTRKIHHVFCRHCGIRSFARGTGPDGAEMVAINVRCLDGVDLNELTIHPYNGKDA